MSTTRRGLRIGGLRFSETELKDLTVAWFALGLAFAIFFAGGAPGLERIVAYGVVLPLAVSLLTAGIAFLLHELAHKVVAVRFGQTAEFRADNGMLFLAVMSALLGFIFAAPGAVHHRGRITERENGLVALAGPVTNLLLMVVFLPILLAGWGLSNELVTLVGERGLAINAFLAAFNLIPYGSLDGRTVFTWSKIGWIVFFVPSVLIVVGLVFVGRLGFGGPF